MYYFNWSGSLRSDDKIQMLGNINLLFVLQNGKEPLININK